jgi:hypothetical protein
MEQASGWQFPWNGVAYSMSGRIKSNLQEESSLRRMQMSEKIDDKSVSGTDVRKRLAELERQVAAIRKELEELTASQPWWEHIAGTFRNDPVYERAMKLGRKYRRAQRHSGSQPRTR